MFVYILIIKGGKEVYSGRDRRAISKKSGISENTLKWYLKKGDYYENDKCIFCKSDIIVGKKGGKRGKKEYE